MLAFGLVFLAGCNVFEGLYDEGGSDDPDVLIADADAALQRGESDKAVQYLEKAFEARPEDPVIRTKLSTALLQQADIDVITMVNLAQDVTGTQNGSKTGLAFSGSALKSGSQLACNFTSAAVEQIDLTQNPSYQEVAQHVATLIRVKALLDAVVSSSDKLSSMPPQLQNAALLSQAITTVLIVLFDIQEKSDELGATIWRLANEDVGLCAEDEAALLEIQMFVKCEQIPEMQNALDLLLQRLDGEGEESAAKEAINEIQESIDLLESQIQITCS